MIEDFKQHKPEPGRQDGAKGWIEMLTERMLEIIEEAGKIRIEDIENLAGLQAELTAAGYTSYVDASTDWLIVEKA